MQEIINIECVSSEGNVCSVSLSSKEGTSRFTDVQREGLCQAIDSKIIPKLSDIVTLSIDIKLDGEYVYKDVCRTPNEIAKNVVVKGGQGVLDLLDSLENWNIVKVPLS